MSVTNQDSSQIFQKFDFFLFPQQPGRNLFHSSNFNRINQNKAKSNSLHTKLIDAPIKNRTNTEPADTNPTQNDNKSSMINTNALERIMTKKENNFKKRQTTRDSLNNLSKNQTYNLKSNQKLYSSAKIDIKQENIQKFKVEKTISKGPLSKNVLQIWLNTILMQSTQFKIRDQSVKNAALKKFEIDQNSLLSLSIKPQNILRIYQSLFVHSIGFNNSIKQLVGGKVQVAKNIWKAYSILLQNCAQGKFETIVGIIQKQKVMKISELRQQIIRRQQVIDRNEQLNQQKNIQVFRQIRALKQQNYNLKNQRDILYEDFQKTEQAFNQEVSLRLKFESKINQLFSMHRQLVMKHSRLYDDFKKKLAQCSTLSEKNARISKDYSDYKIQINQLECEKQGLIKSEKFYKQLIKSLKEEKIKRMEQLHLIQHQYDDQRRLAKQVKSRISHFQIQVKTLQQVLAIKEKSLKQTYSQYHLLVEQNRRLYIVVNEQRSQIQQLLEEKKEFINKSLNTMAQASFFKKKKEEYSNLYYQTDKQLKKKLQRIKSLETDQQIIENRNESLQQDLKVNYQNIQKMHQQNYKMEEELLYLREFKQNMNHIFQEKDKMTDIYREKSQTLQISLTQLKSQYNKLQLSFRTSQQQRNFLISSLNQQVENYKKHLNQIEIGDSERNRVFNSMKLEVERLNKQMRSTILDLKNEKFERFNLKANYDQSLMILEKKDAIEKQLGRTISELKDEVAKYKQEKQKAQLQHETQVLRRERISAELEEMQRRFHEYKQERYAHVHPMVVEDICENFRRKEVRRSELERGLREKEQQLAQRVEKYEREFQNMKTANRQHFEKYKSQKEKQLSDKQAELEYQRQVSSSLKGRLDDLEVLVVNYEKKIRDNSSEQVAKFYSEIIEAKTKSIEELVSKLKIENEQNASLKNQAIEKERHYESHIASKSKEFKAEKSKLEEMVNTLQFESDYHKREADQYQKELKVIESSLEEKLKERMQLYLEQYKRSESVIAESDEGLKSIQEQDRMNGRQKKMSQTKSNWGQLQKVEKGNPEIKKRNSISRKIKIAYSYYKHNQ